MVHIKNIHRKRRVKCQQHFNESRGGRRKWGCGEPAQEAEAESRTEPGGGRTLVKHLFSSCVLTNEGAPAKAVAAELSALNFLAEGGYSLPVLAPFVSEKPGDSMQMLCVMLITYELICLPEPMLWQKINGTSQSVILDCL